jgi:hypothetical protein
MSDDGVRYGALGFKASRAQAWEFNRATVDVLGDHRKDMPQMRIADETSTASMQHELDFGVAAEKIAIAQVRGLYVLGKSQRL